MGVGGQLQDSEVVMAKSVGWGKVLELTLVMVAQLWEYRKSH